MSRNGAGVYTLPPGSTVSNGDISDAADVNTPFSDLETDMNTPRPVVAGGTGASSAAAALVNLGLTATAAELNIMDGVTASAAELNILDGATLTVTELNYVDGATSSIQTQLNTLSSGKQDTITQLPLANGGTGAALADPGADRIMFWDDSAGAVAFLTAGTGLSISGTTMTTTAGWTLIGSQSITSDATGLITGLGAYRDLMIVGDSLDQVLSGNLRLRIGPTGGVLSTSVYRIIGSGANTSASLSDSTSGARGFSVEIINWNTADAFKPVRTLGRDTSSFDTCIGVASTDVMDRFQVDSTGGVNNVASGTLYWWGRT